MIRGACFKKAFSLIEILVVLFMVSVLTTITAPLYFQHRKKAIASETIAIISQIREALRDYYIVHDTCFDITSGNIKNDLPISVSEGVPDPATAGLNIDVGVVQYFSNASYSVDASTLSSPRFQDPDPIDFIIKVDGADSVPCGSDDCAIYSSKVADYRLEADNSDRIFVSFDSGTSWVAY